MSGKATPADPAKIIKPEDDAEGDNDAPQREPIVKFSPEEEAELLQEANAHKTEANALFNSGKYDAAIAKYDEAVSVCPNYLDFELAVLKSNVAACNLKLEEWKDAISTATAAIDKLDKLETRLAEEEKAAAEAKAKEEEEVEEEIISAGAETAGPPVSHEEQEDPEEVARKKKREDIKRIRYKALIRRARARSEAGGWSNLSGAEEDYKTLSRMDNVTPSDRKIVQQQLRTLPAKVKAAQEKETTEMWGKLKDLGNGILKPFGLSTENFQMIQDPKTGGYSMNFKSE
ncbi:Tetratricopeptide repeat protein 1 [Cytospora mali]|uniref:Tetratricopeptide repeat protein 1 n=1 Tax=Cytospora mali TaxID=578113 RepID=A0A194US35_CYTMA|nr:Tetratricopeptide repeat protein 1 [Valsa mali var. pyri (nom. inval.)]